MIGLTLSLAISRTTSSVNAFWYLISAYYTSVRGWSYADGAEAEESSGLDMIDDVDQVGQRRTVVVRPGKV